MKKPLVSHLFPCTVLVCLFLLAPSTRADEPPAPPAPPSQEPQAPQEP